MEDGAAHLSDILTVCGSVVALKGRVPHMSWNCHVRCPSVRASHGAIATRLVKGVKPDKGHREFILVRPLAVKVKA